MSARSVCKLAVSVAVPALLASALLVPQGASAAASTKACDGVRLLSAPYVVLGIGSVVLEVTGPVDDLVQCLPVDLPRSQRAGARGASSECKNAGVAGGELKARRAAKAVRCVINAERAAHGLKALDAQGDLKQAAKRHTTRMVTDGCFSHDCPGEPDLVSRVTSTGYLPCTCTWSVAENIAWGQGDNGSPASIVAAWMASPPHRETILTPSMTEVDVGVRRGKPGAGKAAAATYTADFGYRK